MRTLKRCSSVLNRSPALRGPAQPAPAAARPAARPGRSFSRPASLTGPTRAAGATAPGSAGPPRPPGFGPPPGGQRRWLRSAGAAPHRPLGPAPALPTRYGSTTRWRPAEGAGAGRHSNQDGKEPTPAQNTPNQQPLCPTPSVVPPDDRLAGLSVRACLSRPKPGCFST